MLHDALYQARREATFYDSAAQSLMYLISSGFLMSNLSESFHFAARAVEQEVIMNQIQSTETGTEKTSSTGSPDAARRAPMLPAKGSCWYCERPVDNVRRFCSIACRDNYFEEEGETGLSGS